LLKEVRDIIDKHGTGGAGNDYFFDILIGYDEGEKEIAARVLRYVKYIRGTGFWVSKNKMKWDGYFTFYSARYSCATFALNEGADRNTVSRLLDHENFSTIDNYAGREDDEKVMKAM
jgi:integrase